MTIRQFKTSFFIVIGLCILTIILSFSSFDYIEVDTATDWTMNYFALPILIVVLPSCYYIYGKIIQQHESKKYKSKIWTQLRTFTRISLLTVAITGVFIGTTLSLIILTNAYIGNNRTINLNANIVDYYSFTSKGRTRHYIKIQDQQLDRLIDLKVQSQYYVGQTFKKTMLIGKWGLLYSEK